MPGETKHKILFIEDEPSRIKLIDAAFRQNGGTALPEFVPSLDKAAEIVSREPVDAVFFNIALCGDRNLNRALKINDCGQRQLPLIMIMEERDEEAELRAIRSGIDDCVTAHPADISNYPWFAARALARLHGAGQQAERYRSIARSQKQLISVLDAITDYIFVIDDENRLINVNNSLASALRMHPRDVVGKKCSELFEGNILEGCPAGGMQHDGKPCTYEKAIGSEVFQISIFPLQEDERCLTVVVMKNITELKRLKDQLHYSDKLASIGLLVSGVAHEINNPLTGTIAYTELLNMKVDDENIRQDLNKILESAERCKKIIDNLLTFSRQRKPAKSLESINDIIDRTVQLRNYWLRSNNIEVVRDFDAASTVFVDAQQLQHLILNILLNSEQAIADSGRGAGRIMFTTRCNKKDHAILIRITDNGPGIPAEIMPRIFDPFFTTKPAGIGTGLGLSIAHGIVMEHGGTIHAENEVGGGAAFTIELPTGAVGGGQIS